MFSQYLGYPTHTSTTGNPTTSVMLFSKSPQPPLEHEQIDMSAFASIDTVLGYLKSSAILQGVMDASNGQERGFLNEYAYASAQLTDTIHWSGQTPLALTMDLDWSWLYAIMEETIAEEEGDSIFDVQASLSFQIVLTGIPDAASYSRNFVYADRHHYAVGANRSWRLNDFNGNTLASGANTNSLLHTIFLPAQGGPVNLGISVELGSFASCYVEGRIGQQNCRAASQASDTGYLGIAGDFTSENGYFYPGRSENGGGSSVPEPATLAPVGAALLWLAARTLRRN